MTRLDPKIGIRPMAGGLGAEVTGVDLGAPLDDGAVETVRSSLWLHHVLVFRDQPLTPDAQLGFGRTLGTLKRHPFIASLDGFPEIMVIRKEPEDAHNFAGAWHTDTSYQETPALASMLLAVEVPEDLGDTLFCNMVAAYAALSGPMQEFLDGLEAVHSFTGRRMEGREQDLGYGGLARDHEQAAKVVQPVVRTHGESGQKSVYVNPMFTEYILGLSAQESDLMLSFLYRHCIQPQFVMRLRWRPATVVVWDNATTMHCPLNDYHGHRRVMHRVVVAGNERCGRPLAEEQ